jgi:two-component system, NtrC family, C4-dicarboxylate transport sensor histidine kinase DctB
MREMNERTAADMRASELREALRQANRLATLGQVTASVAHETAQPVAAIRNYAASGETLLDRGDTQTVRENLRSIGRLTERIGRVTEELRGFARKGSDQIGPVPLADILEGAQLILKDSLSRVTVAWPSLTPGLEVMGGRVRLEQVLVILFQNAIEALAGHPEPRIEVTATVARDGVHLTVADNGPGIAPDIVDRIFTPFVTSRPSGLGLGLIIAQDIMSDLGGGLSLLPTTVGAQFEIILRRPA